MFCSFLLGSYTLTTKDYGSQPSRGPARPIGALLRAPEGVGWLSVVHLGWLKCRAVEDGRGRQGTVGNRTFRAALDAGCVSAGCARTRRPQWST